MRSITLVLILHCIASHRVFAQELGHKLMPKMNAVASKDERPVPWPPDMVPFIVAEVRHDGSVGNSGYWIRREDAIRLAEAEAYYDKVHQEHAFEADHYRYRGIARRETEQSGISIIDFDLAIDLAPDDADNYCDRGIAHNMQQEFDKGLADFNQAIRVEPDSTRALMLRGEYWFDRREYEKAIEDFSRAVSIDPLATSVFARRGIVWYRTGELEKAKSDFEESVRVNPNDLYAFRMASWFFLTCKDVSFRNGDLAIKYAQRYCELTSWSWIEALNYLAHGYALNGDFDKAIELLNRAIEIGGNRESLGAVIERFKKRIYEPGPG